MPMLWGRYGPYKPSTLAEKAKARQQAEARRQAQQRRQAWLERYNTCLNGCGKPVAFWDEVNLSLRYSGCCSAKCESGYPYCMTDWDDRSPKNWPPWFCAGKAKTMGAASEARQRVIQNSLIVR